MSMTLTAVVRLIAFLVVGFTVLAVGVSRAVPRVAPTVNRAEGSPRYYGVNGLMLSPQRDQNYLLDAETGELHDLALPSNTTLEFASCSPWRNGKGEHELVGRFATRSGEAQEKVCEGSGLARVGLESRDMLSQMAVNSLVTGMPCWLPGTASRILFPAGDGRLYVQEFGDEDEPPTADGEALRHVVGWGPDLQMHERSIVLDVARPAIASLGGRIFVSLNPAIRDQDRRKFGKPEVWWLTLNPEGTAVESAGRLIRGNGTARVQERMPNLSTTPDGRLVLAYLNRVAPENGWSLRLAPVRTDPGTGDPFVSADETREIAQDAAICVPAFTADGLGVYHVPRTLDSGGRARRISVLDALSLPATPENHGQQTDRPAQGHRGG